MTQPTPAAKGSSKGKPTKKIPKPQAKPSSSQPQAKASKRREAFPTAIEGPHIIHKYANRRLYNTSRREHLTLGGLLALAYEKIPFKVISAKTKRDLTRQVLLSAFLQHEKKSRSPLLSNRILLNLICLQASHMLGVVEEHLDHYLEKMSEQIEPLYPEVGKIISGKDDTGSFFSMAQHNLNALKEQKPWSKRSAGTPPSKASPKP